MTKIKQWTKEELEVIWENRFKLTSPKIAELLPGRTKKSVKHIFTKFRKITPEIEIKLRKQAGKKVSNEIDKELGLDVSTASNYYTLKDIEHMSKSTSYSRYELEYFKKNRWDMKYKDIADHLGVSEKRIINMAHNLDLQTKFVWTDDKIANVISRLENGESIESIEESYKRPEGSILRMLNQNKLYEYVPHSYSNRHVASKPEQYIIDYLNDRFDAGIPEKNAENRKYYWGVIPPYEIDVPFYINGEKFAIEHHALYWHEGREEQDQKKKEIIENKGIHYFEINDSMYNRMKLETMDTVLNKISKEVEMILLSKE